MKWREQVCGLKVAPFLLLFFHPISHPSVFSLHPSSALLIYVEWQYVGGEGQQPLCSAADLLLHLRTCQDKHLEDTKHEGSCWASSAQHDAIRDYDVFVR